MPALEDHLYRVARDALDRIPRGQRSDVYVVSFFTYDEDDDPRRPTVQIGYVTETEAAENAGDLEGRWNLFMPRDQLATVFESSADPEGAQLRESWARENGLWYELAPGENGTFHERGEPLTKAFVGAEISVVQRLHSDGDVVRVFGKPIPLLIHELEYYEAIANQNIEANPPGLVDEFARFCRGDEY